MPTGVGELFLYAGFTVSRSMLAVQQAVGRDKLSRVLIKWGQDTVQGETTGKSNNLITDLREYSHSL